MIITRFGCASNRRIFKLRRCSLPWQSRSAANSRRESESTHEDRRPAAAARLHAGAAVALADGNWGNESDRAKRPQIAMIAEETPQDRFQSKSESGRTRRPPIISVSCDLYRGSCLGLTNTDCGDQLPTTDVRSALYEALSELNCGPGMYVFATMCRSVTALSERSRQYPH